ncbi:hypothetical protein B0T16DRAFT_367938 [Cercophora newfieldiana]|uniref:Uncharacterized protein n=1 Tax=Cercophora newfieldiana TaxID=92897 RepID=A0AA39YG15_9PEZI|nr:hypothetical protein B0T16DRAFT_367938 [Cercophora newfieldiana]
MASWGIDPTSQSRGRVSKSLWQPTGRYSEFAGLEGRNFVFLPGQENKSIAEDGGLIEIQVLRAKDRLPRAPKPQEFRNQENYRIATPSIGLVDEPQDAFYFHWLLIDPTDHPFATFRLHYRSWKSLRHLNLIPSMYSERPLSLRESWSVTAQPDLDARSRTPGPDASYQLISIDEDVFDGATPSNDAIAAVSDLKPIGYFLKSPPERFDTSSRPSRIPQPSKAVRDAFRESYLQRALPELPVEEPVPFTRRTSIASTRSAKSAASGISLTPSLRHYVDDGSFEEDDIEIGVATAVSLPPIISSPGPGLGGEARLDQSADCSVSDYETSPPSTNDSITHDNPSPSRYLPTTGSMLEAQYNIVSPERQSTTSRNPEPTNSPSGQPRSGRRSQLTSMQLSESEWMSRTPSPTHSKKTRGYSPRCERPSGRSLFSGLLKKKHTGTPRRMTVDGIPPKEVHKPGSGKAMKTEDMGGWI